MGWTCLGEGFSEVGLSGAGLSWGCWSVVGLVCLGVGVFWDSLSEVGLSGVSLP